MEIENLKSILYQHDFDYYHIENKDSLSKIHELFKNKIMFVPCNGIECLYISMYYNTIKDFFNEEKYLLNAIKYNQIDAMFIYSFFLFIRDNIKDAKKYLFMAIKNGNSNAINQVGFMYQLKKNYVNAEKYYKMAMEKNNIHAMNNLAWFCYEKNDFINAKKFFLMMFDKNIVHTDNPKIIRKLRNKAMNGLALISEKMKIIQVQNFTIYKPSNLEILKPLKIWFFSSKN